MLATVVFTTASECLAFTIGEITLAISAST